MAVLRLNEHFKYLDALPEGLYPAVVTLHHGSLKTRVTGILQWRACLLRGELPKLDQLDWPQRDLRQTLLNQLVALDLVAQCRNEESLTDHLLNTLCQAIDNITQQRQTPAAVNEAFDGLQFPSSKVRHSAASPANPSTLPGQAKPSMANAAKTSINPLAVDPVATLSEQERIRFLSEIDEKWQHTSQHWQQVNGVFRGMATQLGRGWDLSQGILSSIGWRKVVYYRRLIKRYPQLIDIVDSLGRHQVSINRPAKAPMQKQHPLASTELPVIEEKFTQELPQCIDGITRSDDIARMLPAEAALLGHAKLHLLWHAKRAERALLCYQPQGVLSEHQALPPTEPCIPLPSRQRQPGETIQGPIIICIDTSGSMHGQPEYLAKAISLEVLRLANQQQRACYCYTFSGPQQLIEQQLRFDRQGLRQIIQFLNLTFQGGTDVQAPIQRALEKIQQHDWQKADILFISDGRFVVPRELVDEVAAVRQTFQLRLHGLLIDGTRVANLAQICHPVHRFEQWQKPRTSQII